MEKTLNDHMILGFGFIPLELRGWWLKGCHIDYYEEKIPKPLKIVGFYLDPVMSTRVILDTREIDGVPFGYIYTWATKLNNSTNKKIDAKIREIRAAQYADMDKRVALGKRGCKVHVNAHVTDSFKPFNGTVVAYGKMQWVDFGMVKVSDGISIHTVKYEQVDLLEEPEAVFPKIIG